MGKKKKVDEKKAEKKRVLLRVEGKRVTRHECGTCGELDRALMWCEMRKKQVTLEMDACKHYKESVQDAKVKAFNERKAAVEHRNKSESPEVKNEATPDVKKIFEEDKSAKLKTQVELKIERIREIEKQSEETMGLLRHATIEDISNPCYIEMDAYIDMVRMGVAYGAVIVGEGGIGKTWRVVKHLEGVDYAYTDSYTTPQALYIWLWKNRDKEVVVVDDCAGFLDNMKVLAMLKGGLWNVGENKTRIINYMTTKPMQDSEGNYVPQSFILGARMIILTNRLNTKNSHINAVLSRVNSCIVEIPYEELMSILEQVAQRDYADLTKKERIEVYEYLVDNTSESTESLNIRTLIKCFQQRVYSKLIKQPDRWKELAKLSILKKNPSLVLVEQLIKDPSFKNEKERINAFEVRSGRSKSTYFRMKEQLQAKVKRGQGA